MRSRYQFILSLFVLLLSQSFQPVFAQLGFDLKIDKPQPYDNRTLKAEKTPDKALKPSKKFFQNLSTHYNYFFNANNKLNEVIDDAKQTFRDNYTELLPFYNYTLDATAQNSLQLDSVIYKSRTGLVMHDLRNDWADNMYLLWGAAWFFEKKFDSAALMFQFINYAFAEKEPDGYYRYIGSHMDGNNALTIATDEKKKSTAHFGSRNNAFLWQVRTFIESGRVTDAGTLIATLKDDPFFPKRLNSDLEEVQSYWFYKQNIWDSSAVHLIKALDNAQTKQERARWEYLAAQMFEKVGNFNAAKNYYAKAISHTTDPVMDVYSRLNIVRVTKDTTENYIDRNVAELISMARKDRYADYRDVIYYMAAQMEIDRGNLQAAQELLLKASKYNNGNLSSRANAFLMIADLAYDQKKYIQAAAFYDSVNTGGVGNLNAEDNKRVQDRKALLSKIVSYNSTISRQDSLQRIAAMPEEQRTTYINKLLKKLLKERGLNDVTVTSGNLPSNNNATDLFQSTQSKGEWYFYNNTLKIQGAAQFKQVWGNRPNADNWRRFANVTQQLTAKNIDNNSIARNQTNDQSLQPVDNTPSFASLLNDVPITEAQLRSSNDSISNALFGLGSVLLNDAEDYLSAIDAYEKLRSKYPSYPYMSEVLFNLYYAYKKTGNEVEADKIKQLLLSQYPQSRFAGIISTGKDPSASNKSPEITKTYNDIYNLFLEGRFEEAEVAKKQADSTYKTNYWQPQLLYIEAVYHIRQREDSLAKNSLQTLIGQNPNSPMAKKAQTMIDVLNRRAQIEDELSKYQIQHVEDSTTSNPVQPIAQNPPRQKDTVGNIPKVVLKNDSLTKNPIVTNLPVKKDSVTTKPNMVVNNPPIKKDTIARKPVVVSPPANKTLRRPGEYFFDSTTKHYAAIILDKVDPLFVTEVKNAYSRFNHDHYRDKTFSMNVVDLDATRKIVLVGDFPSAREALNYMQSAKQAATSEVMPWLKAEHYSFSIITDDNLPLLVEKKDLEQYRKFLVQNLPGKF